MYKKFFGFKDIPFQLVPNPAYLFLSKSHEEALANLTYGGYHGDGFVEITGEVGTGKTTLCRVFLERLDTDTVAAYIFNPKLDALQLLKAINDEFGLDADADNTKGLIDTLNRFLIEQKKKDKRVIVIIDEAQNLSKPVLEQLRLLSNLETTTSKLIQIILVGQPELAEMLDSAELRQLRQRISLSAHIVSLTYRETCDYVRHRIHIASAQVPMVKFTRPALRRIYRFSGGIPRLINIACNRSLLTAFGLSRHTVSSKIVDTSIRELTARAGFEKRGPSSSPIIVLIIVILCLLFSAAALYEMDFITGMSLRIRSVLQETLSDTHQEEVTPLESNSSKTAPGATP